MSRTVRISAICVSFSFLLLAVPARHLNAQDVDQTTTKSTMSRIFSALATVLPLSLNDESFRDPKNHDAIAKSLASLAENTSQLSSHGKNKEMSFSYLSRSLARDAKDIERRFQRGKLSETRYLLENFTENCIACHSRLPSQADSPRAEAFFQNVEIATLPLDEKARLQMALRRFEDSMTSYEALFASPDISADQIGLLDFMSDYLMLAVRVKNDLQRPIPVLEKFLKRKDIPLYLRHEVEAWRKSLQFLNKRKPESDELVDARALLHAAKVMLEFPLDRQANVYYLAASGVLHRYLEKHPMDQVKTGNTKVAEAYYLLGTTESHIGRSFWLSQTEHYLEAAIRIAPASPFATKAFDLLEENTLFEYSGSAGVSIPDDVTANLQSLRDLMLQAK